MRAYVIFALLMVVKAFSRLFYRHDVDWVGQVPEDPWDDIRLVAILNHTSLFEWLFTATVPNRLLWRVARHGVVPAAEKTINRPLVGRFYRLVAQHVVSITRERDHTWLEVLRRIGPQALVVILPEGRMKRANGLDSQGNPMTVRGGVADILRAIPTGRLLLAYSGGLHHVQVPGQRLPKLFKRIRMRFEDLDIAAYRAALTARAGDEGFKQALIADLERRRDLYCPPSLAARAA